MKLILVFALIATPLFADEVGFKTERRVSSSYDVIRFLVWKFALPEGFVAGDNGCEKLGFTEHIIAGTVISTLGGRLVDGPEPIFEEWYAGCVVRFAELKLARMGAVASESWVSLPNPREFVGHLVDDWIGPEFMMEDLGITGAKSTLIAKPQNREQLIDMLLSLQFEGTLVSDAYKFYAVVILTLPELRIF